MLLNVYSILGVGAIFTGFTVICKSQWLCDCGMITMKYGSKTTLFCFFAYESLPQLAGWFDVYNPESLYSMNLLSILLAPDAEGRISTS